MKAVRSAPPGVQVVEVDEPDGAGELIQIRAASICASDFNYIAWGSTQLLGHELAGVTQDGTPVAIEGIFGCESCEWCDQGNYNLCHTTGLTALGIMAPGGMSQWFRAPRRVLTPLPAGLDVADASLVEPASVAWHGCRVGRVGPDTTVAVVGAGAIGIIAAVAAQTMGASDVVIEARHPHQREMAERFSIGAPKGMYDVVIETGGTESALHRSIELCRPMGTVVVIGVHGDDVRWPQREAFMKEVRTAPAIGYCQAAHPTATKHDREFGEVAAMLAARPELTKAMITHRFSIDDAPEAFRVAADKSTRSFRVVVDPNG